MNQDRNYYVIVGRDGTRSVSCWLPALVSPAIGRDSHSREREQEPESSAADIQLRNREAAQETRFSRQDA